MEGKFVHTNIPEMCIATRTPDYLGFGVPPSPQKLEYIPKENRMYTKVHI